MKGKPKHLVGKHLERARRREVILYVRASTRRQRDLKRLKQEEKACKKYLRDLGVEVRITIACVEPNSIFKPRPNLERAAILSKRLKCLLVTSTRDRYLRHHGFNGKHKDTDLPTEIEYMMLKRTTKTKCFTLRHPDEYGKSWQVKNGLKPKKQRLQGSLENRPSTYRKPLRDQLLPKIMDLRDRGYSTRIISTMIDIPQPTIVRWVNNC